MAVACSWERHLPLKRNRRQCDFSHRYVKLFRLTFLSPFFLFLYFTIIAEYNVLTKKKKSSEKNSNFNFSHLYVSYETGKMDTEKKIILMLVLLWTLPPHEGFCCFLSFCRCWFAQTEQHVKTFYCWQTNNESCCPAVFQGWNPMCIGDIK